MSIKYGFFNSVNHDRVYNAEDMSHYFEGLITNGIYESIGERLQVTAGGGMSVNVGTGRGMIECCWIKNDATLNLTIDAADVQLNRIDSVIVVWDLTNRSMRISIAKGINAVTPNQPAIVDTDNLKFLRVANIKINAGTNVITQSLITDLRGSAGCPWVTGLIKQVDTSQLFAQWQDACQQYYDSMTAEMTDFFTDKQAEFETWFDTLTETLTVDTYIESYRNSYAVATEGTTFDIGINQYDSSKDILFASLNGVELLQGTEYTISGTGSGAQIITSNVIKENNVMSFVVLKSKIGSST